MEIKLTQRLDAWAQLQFYGKLLQHIFPSCDIIPVQVTRTLKWPEAKTLLGPEGILELPEVSERALWLLRI